MCFIRLSLDPLVFILCVVHSLPVSILCYNYTDWKSVIHHYSTCYLPLFTGFPDTHYTTSNDSHTFSYSGMTCNALNTDLSLSFRDWSLNTWGGRGGGGGEETCQFWEKYFIHSALLTESLWGSQISLTNFLFDSTWRFTRLHKQQEKRPYLQRK